MIKKSYDGIVGRNIQDIELQFQEDPSKILVSVQLEDEQIAHLNSGLTKRHRRLVPLTTLAEFIKQLNSDS